MHELSLCQSIIGIVKDHPVGKSCHRIKRITLEIGQLTAVDLPALHFAFDVVSKNTLAHDAVLEIVCIEGRALCHNCHTIVALKRYYDACEACGHFSFTIQQGEELQIKSMEVE